MGSRCPILAGCTGVALVALIATPTPLRAAPSDPPEEAVLADLPFADDNPYRIHVDLAPKGQSPFVLLLDTGASGSWMSPVAAKERGVNIRRGKSSSYRKKTILDRDLQFWVDTSWSDTGTTSSFEYALLGQDFLRDYVLELDFRERRIRFLDPDRYEVPETTDEPDTDVVPLEFQDTRPKIEVSLDGHTFDVLVDTGAPSTLLLGGRIARKAGIDTDGLLRMGDVSMIAGKTKSYFYEAADFRIGRFQLSPMPTRIAPRGIYNQATPSEAVLGLEILKQFRVRFDFPRRRLWLRRERSEVTYYDLPYARMRETGALLAVWGLEESWVVMVLPDSPAERMELQRDDRISGLSPSKALDAIAQNDSILVIREIDGEEEQLRLPPGSKPVYDVVSEEEQRATWEQRRDERLYVFEKGGWMAVDGYRKRMGPKEDEVWVTYEEMRAIQAGESSSE